MDFGTVRIGLSVCDPDKIIVSPLPKLNRSSLEADQKFLQKLLMEESIAAIVLGLPIHLSGNEGKKSLEVRAFAEWLKTFVSRPVFLWDERFSSSEADELLALRQISAKKRKELRDSLSAVVILQSFIEAGCPEDYTPRALDG
jgi:putative Holliday junction resolvase